MHMWKTVGIAAAAITISLPVVGGAVEKQLYRGSEVVMKVGDKINMQYTGRGDVKRDICLGDVLSVYREMPAGGHVRVNEVGQVKVQSYVGENYVEAQVVSGEVKQGDIVKKNGGSCVVQPQ